MERRVQPPNALDLLAASRQLPSRQLLVLAAARVALPELDAGRLQRVASPFHASFTSEGASSCNGGVGNDHGACSAEDTLVVPVRSKGLRHHSVHQSMDIPIAARRPRAVAAAATLLPDLGAAALVTPPKTGGSPQRGLLEVDGFSGRLPSDPELERPVQSPPADEIAKRLGAPPRPVFAAPKKHSVYATALAIVHTTGAKILIGVTILAVLVKVGHSAAKAAQKARLKAAREAKKEGEGGEGSEEEEESD